MIDSRKAINSRAWNEYIRREQTITSSYFLSKTISCQSTSLLHMVEDECVFCLICHSSDDLNKRYFHSYNTVRKPNIGNKIYARDGILKKHMFTSTLSVSDSNQAIRF